MKNIFKNTLIAVAIIAFAFFFVACGGEDCTGDECFEPVDDNIITDTEPTDDIEPVDNEEPDDVQTDDPEIDGEPDEDITPPSCKENPTCQEVCKNFLDMEGNWNIVEPTTVSGGITVKLSVNGENCNFRVEGDWHFTWVGTEIHQMSCVEYAPIYSFFSLKEMEGEKLVIKKYESEESCGYDGGTFYKFQKIQ